MSVYAYMCGSCDHPLSRHTLIQGGDLVEGPYQCAHCACRVAQNTPTYTFDRRQFEAMESTWSAPVDGSPDQP